MAMLRQVIQQVLSECRVSEHQVVIPGYEAGFPYFGRDLRMTRSYVEFPTVVMTAAMDQLQPSGLLQARYADGSPEKRAENMMNMATRVDVAVATGRGDADLQHWLHLVHLMAVVMHFCDIGGNEERILAAKFLDYDAFGLEAEDME